RRVIPGETFDQQGDAVVRLQKPAALRAGVQVAVDGDATPGGQRPHDVSRQDRFDFCAGKHWNASDGKGRDLSCSWSGPIEPCPGRNGKHMAPAPEAARKR